MTASCLPGWSGTRGEGAIKSSFPLMLGAQWEYAVCKMVFQFGNQGGRKLGRLKANCCKRVNIAVKDSLQGFCFMLVYKLRQRILCSFHSPCRAWSLYSFNSCTGGARGNAQTASCRDVQKMSLPSYSLHSHSI